jgi:hypothetical protein
MSGSSVESWKRFFVKMAEGKIAYNDFYVVNDDMANNSPETDVEKTDVKLISPTVEAVSMAKSELSELPIRERESEEILNKSVLHNSKKPPGKRKISEDSEYKSKIKNKKKTIWK